MKILILGGNSYIAIAFIEKYNSVYDLTVIKRDTVFRDYFDLTLDNFQGFDVVVNFTAIVHDGNQKESAYRKYNYELVQHMADLAKKAGVKQFVQLSTVNIYGRVENISLETVAKPSSYYGIYKLKADGYLQSLEDDTFTVSIVRPPLVYGRDAPGNMSSLVKLVSRGIPLPFGYGKNRRSMLCIENLIDALHTIVEKKTSGVLLLRDKEMPSIGELVETIQESVLGKRRMVRVPNFVAVLLLKSKINIFNSLFGDLIIDDSVTIEKLGEYNKKHWKECLKKSIS